MRERTIKRNYEIMEMITSWVRKSLASMMFLGFSPVMPGTVGAAVTAALIYYFRSSLQLFFTVEYVTYFYFAFLVFVVFSVYVSHDSKSVFGSEDPSAVIIDEAAGMIITLFLMPLTWRVILLGFFLFRFFDIVKPYPVHKFEDLDGGLGIVMDDIVAGVLANISLFATLAIYHAIRANL